MSAEKAATAQRVISAVRARGSDAEDLRDAAHEAVHGLLGNLSSWGRNDIGRSLAGRLRSFYGRSEVTGEEITARAVEAIVCERLCVEHSIERFTGVTLLEAIHGGVVIPVSDAEFAGFVRTRMKRPEAQALADRIIGLGDPA